MTETNTLNARWQRLVQRLMDKETPLKGDTDTSLLQRDVEHLVAAITGMPDTVLTDKECQARLPEYITAEVSGLDVAQLYPEVKRHLERTPQLEAEYVALLDAAMEEDEQEGVLPAPTKRPDLSFLPARLPISLPAYSKWLTREVLQQRAPTWIEDLEVVAQVFFERVAALGKNIHLNAQWAPTLGVGNGEITSPLQILAVTYFATLSLIATLSPAEQRAVTTESLLPVAEQEAMNAAHQLGLSDQSARDIATTYAPLVARHASHLVTVAATATV